VAALGGQWVALGDTWPLTSPDGLVWTQHEAPQLLNAIAASTTEVMAVGEFGAVATSPDGVSWTSWKVGDQRLSGVAWAGTRWVITGASGTILTSP
jgi:hypothetical protein